MIDDLVVQQIQQIEYRTGIPAKNEIRPNPTVIADKVALCIFRWGGLILQPLLHPSLYL